MELCIQYFFWFSVKYSVPASAAFLQDVNDRWSFQYPQLYSPGQLNLYFSKKAFVRCMMHSCYSSLVLFFIPWAAIYDTVRDDGKDVADYQSFALLAQTCLLVVVNIQVRGARLPSSSGPGHLSLGMSTKRLFYTRISFSAVSGHPLLDRGEPVLHVGQPGRLLRHHIHHLQQRHVLHIHLLFPLRR